MSLFRHGAVVACLLFAVSSVEAGTLVGVEFTLFGNGSTVLADDFDNGTLDTPPWFVLGGAPGPEAGSRLDMRGGDFIAQLSDTDPTQTTLAGAVVTLDDFTGDSAVSLLLFGEDASAPLNLLVTPTAAALFNGPTLLGSVDMAAGATAVLSLAVNGNGTVAALINDGLLFEGPVDFTVTGFGVQVVPEPATMLLLVGGMGIGALRRFRRASV